MGPPAERLYAVVPVGLAMMRPSALIRIIDSPSTETDSSMMRESAPCVTTTSFSTMRSARRRPPASTVTCSIIRSSVCAVPLTALSSDVKISGSVTSVRNPRLPKLTPRIGMSESRFRDAASRAEQRAVSTEHDDQVDVARKIILVDDFELSGCPGRRRERGRFRIEDGRQLPFFEPRRNLREVARRPVEARFRNHADGAHHSIGRGAPRPAPRRSLAGTRPAPLAALLSRWRKNSRLPVSPVIGDSVMAWRTNPTSAAARDASSTTRACTAGSRITPFLPTSARPASNCGFTSATTSAPSRSSGGTLGKMCRNEMNDTSMVTMSNECWQVRRLERPRIRALDDDDAGIVAQAPIELAVADVEGDDPARAALEQHVGESAGRCADVERLAAVDGYAERVERMRQLDPASADVRMIRLLQRDGGIVRHRHSGFLRRLSVDEHDAGEDERARALARRGQPALHEEDVEALFQFVRLMTQPRDIREPRVLQLLPIAARRSRRRAVRRRGAATRRGRRWMDRSACPPWRPYRRSCRDLSRLPRHRECRRRSERPGRDAGRILRPRESASSLPPPMMAPATAAARISAPVLRACMSCSEYSSNVDEPTASRSIACPPTMPRAPAASAIVWIVRIFLAASSGSRGSVESSANASVSSPSPARMAIPSPWTTWFVGRPRRSESSSIAGRSSWMSE